MKTSMISALIKNVFGTRNDRVLKSLRPIVSAVNALEPEFKALSDSELKQKTAELKARVQGGATLDEVIPVAFAVVREASVRTLGLRHFDVQLIGGLVLHDGKIAEMRTGEGKTLVSTLAAYINALTGNSVHIITVNDYLARRDAAWMSPIYDFLGLTVGVVLPGQSHEDKQAAYAKDIVYGTNNEFGFDYLRDNMAFAVENKVQRGLHYAIIDEVDSILIDEARTPLIISGQTEDKTDLYIKMNALIPSLQQQQELDGAGDYLLDEKVKQAFLTEVGHQNVERLFVKFDLLEPGDSLYEPRNIKLLHHLNAALRAHALFHRDVDYIVKDDEVVIVDEHTGRTMEGRRWSDGLHQAIEAKEKVTICNENQTLASITFQNYFRLYEKIAGMTGTADTEAYEFQQIYGLEVIVIPTNRPMVRADLSDQIYLSAVEKFKAIINDIQVCRAKGQPVLVGTASIETSEQLSKLLTSEHIPHQVLNAKHHESEAKIITQAGQPGAVTVATNMAGRGTDIVLGGNLEVELAALEDPTAEVIAATKAGWQKRHAEVVASGGLHVIGSGRHESRRIDNQLRGRSGRQGDPGSSRFYLSLEDNLMRIFASEKIAVLMKKLGMQEHEVIEHAFITRAVENAQRKVEGHNFDIRKHLLEFDDVANEQRKVIYEQRDELMVAQDISNIILGMYQDAVNDAISIYVPHNSLEEQWDISGLELQLREDFGIVLAVGDWLKQDMGLHEEQLRQRILDALVEVYHAKEAQMGTVVMRQFEKNIMLQVLDTYWKEHLAAMDHLREGIHLRGYAQQNPKQEYKRESFVLFTKMLDSVKHDVVSMLCTVNVRTEDEVQSIEDERKKELAQEQERMSFIHSTASLLPDENTSVVQDTENNGSTYTREGVKVGRNEPCHCGSGKKYKQCHGKLD